MRKLCIVMPYYDRQYQLDKTLDSLMLSKHTNFSVIIVDDNSPQDIVLPSVPFDVEVIKLTSKTWTNVSPVYNMGFNKAKEHGAEVVIIQSSECYHVGDVLLHAEDNIKTGNYIAYGCFQIDKDTTFSNHDIMRLSKQNAFKVDGDNKGKGVNAWWNHSVYSPLPQYWGAAISMSLLKEINGIDERFAYGHAYEDGWFLYQLKNIGANIESVDYPFVVHQWHSRQWVNVLARKDKDILERNKELYLQLIETKEYRSQHFITPDL